MKEAARLEVKPLTRRSLSHSLALLLAIGTGSLPALAQPAEPPPSPPAAPAPVTPGADPRAAPETERAPNPAETPFADRLEQQLGVPGGLTAEDVAARAVATSYELEASRADVLAAAAEVDRAFAGYFPELKVLARYTRLSEVDDTFDIGPGASFSFDIPLNQYALRASLLVPVSDYFLRVSKGHDAAARAEAAARNDLASTELATIANAKTTYYNWVAARLRVLVAEQGLADSRAHLADARNALAAGAASPADVLAVEARVANDERAVESAVNLAAKLEEQLRILRHDPPNTTYAIGEDLKDDAAETPSDVSALVRIALASRPELTALEQRARSIEGRIAIERAAAYPRFDLFANAQYENPNSRIFPQRDEFSATWDVGAQLSWTLSDIPRAGAGARSLRSNAEALRARRRALMDQIRNEVVAAHTDLLDARAAIRTSARSLAAAEESHRVRRVLFQNGRATSVEVMDAEFELTQARLAAVNARIQLRAARVRLDYALGRPAPSARRGAADARARRGTE